MAGFFEGLAQEVAWWPAVVVLLLLAAVWRLFARAVEKPRDRDRLGRILAQPSGLDLYCRNVDAALDWLDRRLRPPDGADDAPLRLGPVMPDRAAAARVAAAPFGWPLLDLALRAALAYPLGLFVLSWGVFGAEGRLGTLAILPGTPPSGLRVAALAVVVLFAASFLWPQPTRRRLQGAAVALALAGSAAGTYGGYPDPGTVEAGLSAVFLAMAGLVTAQILGSVAIALAYGMLPGMSVAVVDSPDVTTGAAAAAVLALVLALPWALRRAVRAGVGVLVYLGWIAAGVGALLVVSHAGPGWGGTAFTTGYGTVLLFLLVLPLVNGVFDYLSIGWTRLLLRRGTARPERALLYGGLDVAVALALFVLLRGALVIAVHAMNTAAGAPIVDLPGVFADLRGAGAWQYAWLYAAIFSALVPTLLHLSIALWSLGAMVPVALRRGLADLLGAAEESAFAQAGAVSGLTMLVAWTVLAPLALTLAGSWLVVASAPWLGTGYLWLFERLAQVIGAGVVPGGGAGGG